MKTIPVPPNECVGIELRASNVVTEQNLVRKRRIEIVRQFPCSRIESISDAADRDPHIYTRPEIWGPVEKVYRAYLG